MRSFSPRPREVDVSKPPSDRYRILGRIARGSMADVHLARMETRNGGWREVAMKFISPRLKVEKDFVDMFYDEARIASHLVHDNIVQIYELGELDESFFISMELVRGVNLAEIERRASRELKRIPAPVAIAIACGALDALQFAHTFSDLAGWPLNIVHRDVCPENVLLGYQGQVKLTDFGIAKAEGRLHKTGVGQLKGKLFRMAPEQLAGQKIDHRADVFALGGLLYELLLDAPPFEGETELDRLQAMVTGQPTAPSSIDRDFPTALSAILLKALARDPLHRFQSALEMKLALERYLGRLPPAETLARFVRDLFADKLKVEEVARRSDDDAALVRSMAVSDIFSPVEQSEPEALEEETLPPSEDLRKLLDEHTEPLPRDDRTDEDNQRVALGADTLRDIQVADVEEAAQPETVPMRLGRYRLIRRIGGGKTADVYVAVQSGGLGFEKTVALKVIDRDLSRDKVRVDRFVKQARKAARLSHPNLVQLFDFETAGGQYFVSMEFIEGWDLSRILDRSRALRKEMPLSIACRIARELCSALTSAHSATGDDGSPEPIVHLGIAPTKVIISGQGAVKLTDLGIGRALGRGFSFGDTVGSARYLAPEVSTDPLPAPDADVDPRADLFSVGALLYEMLTSRPLWTKHAGAEGSAGLEAAPRVSELRREIPPRFEALMQRVRAKDPADRHASAVALELELERQLTELGEPVTPHHVATWTAALFRKTSQSEASRRG